MNFTIFGYPQTGKTTLFNLLTGEKIKDKSHGALDKAPNLRTCPVPDARLEKVCALFPDKKKKSAVVDYADLAGVSYGEVKGQAYLNHMRKADGLVHVARGFMDPQVPSLRDKIDPEEDILAIEEEILLADLVSIESRLEKLEKELQRAKNPEGEKEREVLRLLKESLEKGQAVRDIDLKESEKKLIRGFAFLSQKPLLHMINLDEKDTELIETPDRIHTTGKKGVAVRAFCGKIEMEIMEIEGNEKTLFLEEYGLKELSADSFLKTSYELLNVITFFTIGKDEVKAWTIRSNTTAVNAAGAIHSDIEKGFIRAEVIPWEDLITHTSLQAAKEKAAVRLEGKDYTVQDGDVIYFRFAK